jgi:hypothetical protein
MGAWGSGHSLVVPVPSPQASLMGAVTAGTINSSLSRSAWLSLAPGVSLQPNCNDQGYDIAPVGGNPFAEVRIGLVTNQENDCGSPDSFIGFGAGPMPSNGCGYVNGTPNISAGWADPSGCGGSGTGSNGRFGYVFIR